MALASLPTLVFEIAFRGAWNDATTIYSAATAVQTTPAAVGYVDCSAYVMSGSVERGRSYRTDYCEPGKLSITLLNTDGRFDPLNASTPYQTGGQSLILPMKKCRLSAIWNGVTYRLFVGYITDWAPQWNVDVQNYADITITAQDGLSLLSSFYFPKTDDFNGFGAGTVKLGTYKAKSATWAGGSNFTAPDFGMSAFAKVSPGSSKALKFRSALFEFKYTNENGTSGQIGLVYIDGVPNPAKPYPMTMQSQDGVRSIQSAKLVGGSFDGDPWFTMYGERAILAQGASDVQLGKLLDRVGWNASDRNLAVGQHTMIAQSNWGAASLDELRAIQDSELGFAYVGGDGRMQFESRVTRYNGWKSGQQATFGDAGSELKYVELEPSLDFERVLNDIQVTRVPQNDADTPVMQEAQDTTSQNAYGLLTDQRDPRVLTDAIALKQAQWLLAANKDALYRFPSITIKPQGDSANLYPVVFGADLSYRTLIKRRPPAVGLVQRYCNVEGIKHDFDPASWLTTWQLSPRVTVAPY